MGTKYMFWVPIILTLLLVGGQAYGEDCSSLNTNEKWQKGIDRMIQSVNDHNYKDAISQAELLYPICRQSPILNYYTGLALLGQGERDQALIYFQKASDFITEIAVDPGISRRIWYARYELEHPECSRSSMLDQTREIAKLKIENEQHRSNRTSTELALASEWKMLWTGAGIGMAGLVVAGVGIGMGMNLDNVTYSGNKMQVSTKYLAGWGMFGAGLGMLVSGTIMTGVAGYRYTHHKYADVLSWRVGPGTLTFQGKF